MAVCTTFGLLFLFDFKFTGLLATVPFLVLSIGTRTTTTGTVIAYDPGVDDSFVLLASMRFHSGHGNDGTTGERVGTGLAMAAGSISVISLTDVLCFVVGMQSNVYGVTLFRWVLHWPLWISLFMCSVYAAIALTIDYIYQMTFYIAIIAIIDQRRANTVQEKDKFVSVNVYGEMCAQKVCCRVDDVWLERVPF
jgi:hypothetical protein